MPSYPISCKKILILILKPVLTHAKPFACALFSLSLLFFKHIFF